MMMRELEDSGPRNSTKPDEEFYTAAVWPAAPVARVTIEVIDPSGLHMRSAGSFVRTACGYQARIWIRHHDARLDAKSILDVLMAAAGCGTRLLIEASGPDAEEAIRALSGLDPICKAV
jgi:phosphocarrier protein HPr